MGGHENRKLLKMNHIKKSTIELYNRYGIQKVTIDEIASHANVSKVTIYKYFNSKEELISTIINEIYNNIIISTQKLIATEDDFLNKLTIITKSKMNSSSIFQGDFLEELFLSSNSEAFKKFHQQIKELMFEFFEEGKKQGYIDKNINNEVLYTYSEIFNSGLQSLTSRNNLLLKDKEALSTLIHLYFHGLIETD